MTDAIYERSIGTNAIFDDLFKCLLREDIFKIGESSVFPLSRETVNNSGYVERRSIEEPITSHYLRADGVSCLILVGKEGMGKTTTLRYLFCYDLYTRHKDHAEKTTLILLNAKNWRGEKNAHSILFNKLQERLLNGPQFADLRTEYENYIPILESRGSQFPHWSHLSRDDQLVHILSYVYNASTGSGTTKRYLTLVLDNMDQLLFEQQLDVFYALQTLIDNVRDFTATHYGRPQYRGRDCRFRVVVALRPETAAFLRSTESGVWPPEAEHVDEIDISRSLRVDPFRLAEKRLINNEFFNRRNLKVFKATLKTTVRNFPDNGKTGLFDVTDPEPEELIKDLVAWLMKQCRGSEIINRFCAGSIRRALRFAYKVIGHPAVFLRFYSEVHLKRRNLPAIEKIVWDAMWDFYQPLGTGDVLHKDSFMFNPYDHIVSARQHEDAEGAIPHPCPLLLIYLIESIREMAHGQQVRTMCIFERLMAMAYPPAAIFQGFQKLVRVRMIIPASSLHFGTQDNVSLVENYDVDREVLNAYWKLINFKNLREEAWLPIIFFTHCYRDRWRMGGSGKDTADFGRLDSFLEYRDLSRRYHMSTKLLEDIVEEQQYLEAEIAARLVGSTAAIPRVSSYAKRIGNRATSALRFRVDAHLAEMEKDNPDDDKCVKRLKDTKELIARIKGELASMQTRVFGDER